MFTLLQRLSCALPLILFWFFLPPAKGHWGRAFKKKKKKWEDPMQMAFVRVSPEISVN